MSASTVNATYGFSAPPEVVFGTLTDPDRTTRWLPERAVAEDARPDRVRVRAFGRVAEFDVSRAPGDMRVTWTSVDDPALYASASVRDADAGGSTVDVEIAAPAGVDAERVRGLLDETARRLGRDVSDNFTAG